jgi:4-oxalocrotonate tautomerase
MPLITMHMYPGRTAAQKEALVRGLTEVVSREINVPQQTVEILLIEVARDNWSFGGKFETKPAAAPATT